MKRHLLLLVSLLTSICGIAEVNEGSSSLVAYENIKAKNVVFEGNRIVECYQRIRLTVVNEGTEEFNDRIRLVDNILESQTTFYIGEQIFNNDEGDISLQPGESKDVYIDFKLSFYPTKNRIYMVAGKPFNEMDAPNLIPDDKRSLLMDSCDVEMTDWIPRNIDAEITIDNSLDRNGVMTTNVNYVAGGVKLINNDDTPMFQKWFYLTLTKCPDGDVVKPENELAVQVIAKELLANQTVETPFAFDETALEDGQRYALSVKYSTPDGRADTTPLFFTYENPTGIKDIERTSATPKLYDLSGRRLTREPERGVYIRDGRKVVIK